MPVPSKRIHKDVWVRWVACWPHAASTLALKQCLIHYRHLSGMAAKVAHSTYMCPPSISHVHSFSLTPNAKGLVQGPSPFILDPAWPCLSKEKFLGSTMVWINSSLCKICTFSQMSVLNTLRPTLFYGCSCLPFLASSLSTLIWHVTSAVSQSSHENQNRNFPWMPKRGGKEGKELTAPPGRKKYPFSRLAALTH